MNRNVTMIAQKNKMIDPKTKRYIDHVFLTMKLSKDENYNCWWCRLNIENAPIGCPMAFEKDTTSAGGTYFTDGIFCSVNCVKAYILEYYQEDSKYRDSIRLLSLMLAEMTGDYSPKTIKPALPWKILKQHGGHINPDKYKEMCKTTIYIQKSIKMKPITIIYEVEEEF